MRGGHQFEGTCPLGIGVTMTIRKKPKKDAKISGRKTSAAGKAKEAIYLIPLAAPVFQLFTTSKSYRETN